MLSHVLTRSDVRQARLEVGAGRRGERLARAIPRWEGAGDLLQAPSPAQVEAVEVDEARIAPIRH